MNDTFVLGFFIKKNDGTIRIIHEYTNNHKALDHYADICDAVAIKFGWVLGNTYTPHDGAVQEMTSGKTRIKVMEELGFEPILLEKLGLLAGIEITRKFLKNVEIYEECTEILIGIQNYRKTYDRTYDVFLPKPVHDKNSHPADAVRYLAIGDKFNEITDLYSTPKDVYSSSYRYSDSYDV